MEEIKNDKRFSHILTNPKYFKMGRKIHKAKVDSRFKEMFKDKNFKLKYTVDNRGRPWISSTNEDLKKYYDLTLSDKNDSEDNLNNQNASLSSNMNKSSKSRNNENKKLLSEKKNKSILNTKEDINISRINKSINKNKSFPNKNNNSNIESSNNNSKVDNSNDIKNYIDDDSCDNYEDEDDIDDDEEIDEETDKLDSEIDSCSDDEIQNSEITHAWGELDHDVPRTDSITCRLALCNIDWDRIKSNDIFVMLSSFKPEKGNIKSVKIYLSDYGKERLEIENIRGPPELTEHNDTKDDDDSDGDYDEIINIAGENSDGSKFHQEKLRQYQLSRLKYYYAVIECDTTSTADFIYNNCNGIEYESSANLIDLRFIPDDMSFNEEPVTACLNMPCEGTYKPSIFTCSALHQSNVELTWDETPADRVALTMRDFSKCDFEKIDVKEYLASASEEENEEKELLFDDLEDNEELKDASMDEQIKKYRDLLNNLDENKENSEDDVDMEITWEPGLKEIVEQKLEKKNSVELTPWEKYLDKKSKKNKLTKNKGKNVPSEDEDLKINSKVKGKKKSKKTKKSLTIQEQAELELLVMDDKSKKKFVEKIPKKKEKSTDCDSALIPLLCVHG